MKNLNIRFGIVAVIILAAIIYVLPTFKPTLWPYKKINLGLDLQGGMHLALEVDTDKAVENTVGRIVDELITTLKKENIRYLIVEQNKGNIIAAKIAGKEEIDKFKKYMDKEYRELRLVSESNENDILTIKFDLPEREIENIKKMAVEQALETIRNRIDQFGVSEPDIRIQGEKRILVQLPGIKDPARAKQLIGKTALLEFKLVVNSNVGDDPKNIPAGCELIYEIKKDRNTNRETKIPYIVEKRARLTGTHLTDARVQLDASQKDEPYVGIKFDKKGAKLFAQITEENVKKQLAIVLDNKIYSAPVIQEKIPGGEARITGSFSAEEAHDLTIVLRAGALPAPVHFIEERTVGPSLGRDSINKGLMSMALGGCIVIIFMAVFYQLSGLLADLVLTINILLIAAGLAMFQATLTLPGIAGIILTIGMAVDANVLVYERIKEELGLGKTPRAAVNAGFDRATLTILDANVTTLIAALVLFQFGTGPVKGFAVTLSLGVIASMFTALVLARLIFDYILEKKQIKNLSI
ncbi:MAG: protein translocase subunit SecD [Desulfobacterales bacterium]|nr:protein translocase subunit SecD [Desulfobacterales bacterium]